MFSFLQRSSRDALIRPLTMEDRANLEAMINTDPVAFLYAAEHLDLFGLPASSAMPALRTSAGFMGIFEPTSDETTAPVANAGLEPEQHRRQSGLSLSPRIKQIADIFLSPISQARPSSSELEDDGEEPLRSAAPISHVLVGAFWLGSNCVPLVIPDAYRAQVATVIARSSRTVASIFGAQQDVLGLWELLAPKMGKALSIRENQPLLYLPLDVSLERLAAQSLYRPDLEAPQVVAGGARWARTSDRQSLLKASVAMFTEEVGYDPMSRDPVGYARRVDEFIRTGRSVVATNDDGVVVFKADLGLAHADVCQIQGVWLHPAYRGFGLSEPLLAQAFQLIRPRFPHISLYVNDFNTRARKLYAALGMSEENTFATILF
ncbi:GNAT family N-acetyltransferase [Rothia sp. ND6WE1A]|uniref:GNAT family N-acetyltransferase n=1 Tax=Rothia sp. ND6WE1A TaxID=1848190 RepID=UPI0008356EAB|nr:GNAT family N-acetyltransferase [Rothia sp. ND6WE1A]